VIHLSHFSISSLKSHICSSNQTVSFKGLHSFQKNHTIVFNISNLLFPQNKYNIFEKSVKSSILLSLKISLFFSNSSTKISYFNKSIISSLELI
jgi:hypothetical protein